MSPGILLSVFTAALYVMWVQMLVVFAAGVEGGWRLGQYARHQRWYSSVVVIVAIAICVRVVGRYDAVIIVVVEVLWWEHPCRSTKDLRGSFDRRDHLTQGRKTWISGNVVLYSTLQYCATHLLTYRDCEWNVIISFVILMFTLILWQCWLVDLPVTSREPTWSGAATEVWSLWRQCILLLMLAL